MSKKLIRLTESDLHNIIKKSVKKVIKEINTSLWQQGNDAKYKQAVDILSNHVLDYIEPEEIINNPDCVEDEVKDSWQDILDGDILDAVYDRYDVASVINKNYYGGGGFEALRQLQMDVRDNVLNILQNEQNH